MPGVRLCLGVSVACYLNPADLCLLKRSQYLHRLLQLKLLEGWGRYCACRVAFGREQLFPSSHRNSCSCSGEDASLSGSFLCRGACRLQAQTRGSSVASKSWRHRLKSAVPAPGYPPGRVPAASHPNSCLPRGTARAHVGTGLSPAGAGGPLPGR